jgi:hypothetical protein
MVNQFCLRMGTELVPETLYSNELTRLCALEIYIELCRRESFKTYTGKSSHVWKFRYRNRNWGHALGFILSPLGQERVAALVNTVMNIPVSWQENSFLNRSNYWIVKKDIEICGLLGYYTASCGNYLPTFRDNVLVPSESWPVRMGPIRCLETSVNDYHTTPCNNPEDHRFHQHRGGSLKLKKDIVAWD